MTGIKAGTLTKLTFETREFDAIVIDPNGLGKGQPSVGFGYRMVDRYAGIPESTIRSWVREDEGVLTLTLPSGKTFEVRKLLGSDGNDYRVLEASEWFELAVDLLVEPGQTGKKKGTQEARVQASKALREKLGEFIRWFAVKGFYAEAYVALKGVYTERDSRATTQWLEMRQLGKVARKVYTDLLQSQGCESSDYAQWTDYVYKGLFGEPAWRMKQIWEVMDGDPKIARNYIPKTEGLDAVRHCEDMVVRMFVDSLEEAHDSAINLTRRKFLGGL